VSVVGSGSRSSATWTALGYFSEVNVKIPIEQVSYEKTEDSDDLKADLENISSSLKEVGLSHPIIVRPANGSYSLVSGEKRLRAAELAGWKEIEAEIREVSEIQGKIIQTHENLKRHNLPWWEEAALIQALHAFRQSEHGEGQSGRPKRDEPKKTGWGIRDTAIELGKSLGPIAEDLQLARAVQLDPSLRNIRDKKTAIRLVRIAAQRHQAEEEAGLGGGAGDFAVNQTYLGDSASILSQFPAQSIDHCITDPPWIKFFDETLTLDKRTLPVLEQVYRVLRHDGFLFMFCGFDDLSYYCGFDRRDNKTGDLIHTNGELERLGFNISKSPMIWHKLNSMSRRGVRSWEYDRNYELGIIATKGSPAMTAPTVSSAVKTFPVVPPVKLIHPNEKPVELLKDIINDLTYEGNIILDPFGGSFVTAVAAKESKRRYVICERDKKFYDAGRKRLGFKE
jgi:DNA modification methylase